MPGRKRLPHLDLFRALAIVAVLVIHTTSSPVAALPKHSHLYPVYFIANSVCQFAVPSFLFLSSLVLFYNYYGAARIDWKAFFAKRGKTIVVPYVIASFLYCAADLLIKGRSLAERWPSFLKGLPLGLNYFHLYFVAIIVQFFILFPLMLAAARALRSPAALIAAGIGLQAGFYLANYYLFDMERVGTFVGSYMLYLFLGAAAGIAMQTVPEETRKRRGRPLLYSALALLAAAFTTQLWLQQAAPHWIGQPWRSLIHAASAYAYCSACCFALLDLSRRIRLKRPGWSERLLPLGETSFGIYLIHPFVLLLWRREMMVNDPLVYHPLIWTGGAVALVLSWLATYWLQRTRWGVYLVGGSRLRSPQAFMPSPADTTSGYGLRKS